MKKSLKAKNHDVTTNDIMDFLVEHMATKEELRYEIGTLRAETKEEMGKLRSETKEEIGKLRSDMIDYIGQQMNDLKVDLSTLIRQNDRKVTLLLDILLANKIITQSQAKKVHSLSVA